MDTKVMTGSRSVATAVMMAKPDVIAAYPITPQTEIVEDLSKFVADKQLSSKFIRVDSEHSAMGACIGSSAAGARTFTATSSHGLMYMAEVVHWASHARLPMVMAVATRALAAPWSILNEHTDFMIQHTSGWIQIMVENNQEAFDTTIQAFRLSEDKRISLPVMIGLDGFILTHSTMPVSMPSQNDIDAFLGKRKPLFELDVDKPITIGNVIMPEHYTEIRRNMFNAMMDSKKIIKDTAADYSKISGRDSPGLVDPYNCDGAEHLIITMGASSGDAKVATDALRKEGIKAGLLRIRVMRPFPSEEITEMAGKVQTISIVERSFSAGIGNILAQDIKSAIYPMEGSRPFIKSYIAGLGGRDITPEDYIKVVKSTMKKETGDEWVNLKM